MGPAVSKLVFQPPKPASYTNTPNFFWLYVFVRLTHLSSRSSFSPMHILTLTSPRSPFATPPSYHPSCTDLHRHARSSFTAATRSATRRSQRECGVRTEERDRLGHFPTFASVASFTLAPPVLVRGETELTALVRGPLPADRWLRTIDRWLLTPSAPPQPPYSPHHQFFHQPRCRVHHPFQPRQRRGPRYDL